MAGRKRNLDIYLGGRVRSFRPLKPDERVVVFNPYLPIHAPHQNPPPRPTAPHHSNLGVALAAMPEPAAEAYLASLGLARARCENCDAMTTLAECCQCHRQLCLGACLGVEGDPCSDCSMGEP